MRFSDRWRTGRASRPIVARNTTSGNGLEIKLMNGGKRRRPLYQAGFGFHASSPYVSRHHGRPACPESRDARDTRARKETVVVGWALAQHRGSWAKAQPTGLTTT